MVLHRAPKLQDVLNRQCRSLATVCGCGWLLVRPKCVCDVWPCVRTTVILLQGRSAEQRRNSTTLAVVVEASQNHISHIGKSASGTNQINLASGFRAVQS